MKRLLYTAFILVLISGMTGCYKDIIKPELAVDPDGPPQPVSFKTELVPIFNAKCTEAGCHVSGSHKPYMTTTDNVYNQIVGGGFINTALPKESILYRNIFGEMAPYIPSASDKQKVYDWIRNGAPNN